jgi:hypothetical protein
VRVEEKVIVGLKKQGGSMEEDNQRGDLKVKIGAKGNIG